MDVPVTKIFVQVHGTVTWAANNTEDGNEININQVDIPIRPNESVEIRVKALSEASYNWHECVMKCYYRSDLE